MFDSSSYKEIIDLFFKDLTNVTEELASVKLSEDKWALKEIIGHLIDSASNNHQRFARLQFGDLLDFPSYEPEEWIKVQKYTNLNWNVLLTLWYSLNCHLLNIIEITDESVYENVWIKEEEAIPFKELVPSYFKHMKIHIDQFNKRLEELQIG